MSQKRKSIRKSNQNQPSPRKTKTSKRQKLITAGVVILALLFALSMFLSTPNNTIRSVKNSSNQPIPNANSKPAEPQFVKEGDLQFYKNGTIVKGIEIEIADNVEEIKQGLMFRQKMDEGKGMLFIFPDMQPRGFWMKNTLIPLDIIYVDADKTIVSIQKNTTPLSEKNLPSDSDAQYVIEVNAGFSDRYGLKAGDKVDFQR
jgi:uncharacterized membrane protein (UPF0127 family)